MKIHSIYVENFRPFKKLEEMRTGSLATIVGKNDVGKSNILRALKFFFAESPKIDESDVHEGLTYLQIVTTISIASGLKKRLYSLL